jgi:hypothetical protein
MWVNKTEWVVLHQRIKALESLSRVKIPEPTVCVPLATPVQESPKNCIVCLDRKHEAIPQAVAIKAILRHIGLVYVPRSEKPEGFIKAKKARKVK